MRMTLCTNRNNIKPMLREIAPVMILLGLCRTVKAFQRIGPGQLTSFDGQPYGNFCLRAFRMSNLKSFLSSNFDFSALFALTITFKSSFALFGFLITKTIFAMQCLTSFCLSILFYSFQAADFAISSISILVTSMLIKLSKWFCIFANSACFCFNWFSHNRLFTRRFWLEPRAPPVGVFGSLYCGN